MRPFSRLFRSHALLGMLVGTAIAVLIIGIRGLGYLQQLELGAYDHFLNHKKSASAVEAPVTLVTVTEADIKALGQWPMSDETLSRLLRAILQRKPRVIGLDLYRDIPVPPGSRQLVSLFQEGHQIVSVRKIGDRGQGGVAGPYMSDTPDLVGFNDIPVDQDGTIRRGLLFMEDGESLVNSFSLLLALSYLRHDSILAGPDPDKPDYVRIGKSTFVPFSADDGGYIKADAGGYQLMLDFGSKPFQTVPLGDLLSGAAGNAPFQDRVVIIGSVAESMKDVFVTPVAGDFSGARLMQGLEVHAHATSQIIRAALTGKGLMRPVAERLEWLLIVAAGIAGGMLSSLGRSFRTLLLIVLGGLAFMVSSAYLAFMSHYWVPVVPPVLSWAISIATMSALLSYREKNDRRVLMRIFSSHVSKDVAETLWQERDRFLVDGRLIPKKITATVLFTDLQNFTAIAEKQGPDELMGWLNTYLNAMADSVMRHKGMVNKFIGDAVMAVYGPPLGDEDPASISTDAKNAARSALAMRRALENLNQEWENTGKAPLSMRVGIHTGPVVAGNIGSSEKMEYTVIGDTVNTAARLEGYLKELGGPDAADGHCGILISEATHDLIGPEFITGKVGEIRVKGKEKGLTVYRLLGQKTV